MAKQRSESVKLTNTVVERLTPKAGGYYDVRDTEVRGFMVRVQPSGAKTFYVRYTLPGRRQRYYRIGDAGTLPVAEAREAARAHWASVVKGTDPMVEKQRPKEHTLRSFLTVYQAQAMNKTAADTVARVKRCFMELLDKPLGDIRPMWIKQWRKERREAGKADTAINRDVAALRSVLTVAVAEHFLTAHPLETVKPLRVDTATAPRYLAPDEEARLLAALDAREETMRAERDSFNEWRAEREYEPFPDLRTVAFADYLKPMTLLALNTGMRRGEIFNLQWRDCQLEGDHPRVTIHGHAAKGGRTRHVPLNEAALDTLKKWREQTGGEGLVFPSPKSGARFDNIRNSWAKVVKEAGIKDFRFHDCRHHFASMLVQSGIDLNVVRELLGHASLTMTLRYAHLAPGNAAAAVAALDRRRLDNVVQFKKAEAAE